MMCVSHKSLHALYREVQIIYVVYMKRNALVTTHMTVAIMPKGQLSFKLQIGLYTLQTLVN